MFKYKDLRMFVFSLFLIGLCVFSGVYFRHDRMKLVVVLLLAFSVIPTLLIRYNASVFEDGMLIYTFRGIGILPQMIEFKDLTAYELISKHKLQLGFLLSHVPTVICRYVWVSLVSFIVMRNLVSFMV